ncbi:MAG: DNA-directed RNA polymerase subunit beta' [Patescibacteria group bacterium]
MKELNISVDEIDALRLGISSPQDILTSSFGEILKPETINYRTQRPVRGGLFCEKIFGPTKNWQCYCGKYKRVRYKGVVCDRCGVEVAHSSVRRFRMGHIKLGAPVVHPWFLRSNPGILAKLMDIPQKKLEQVVYFAGYIVKSVVTEARDKLLEDAQKLYQDGMKELIKEYELLSSKISDSDEKERIKQEKQEKEKLLKQKFVEIKNDCEFLKVGAILSEDQFFAISIKYSHIFTAGIGASAILDIVKEIDVEVLTAEIETEIKRLLENAEKNITAIKKLRVRLNIIKGLRDAGIKPEWMFLTILPVIPPDLRPMVELDGGRYATSDLNDLYRRVLSRNNRLKRLISVSAPDVITRNEKRMLQEAVDALIDKNYRSAGKFNSSETKELKSISDFLRGKQGRFRQNLLGKRVDYSGRAVIVPGPNLKINQCGVPKTMALELFSPFVVSKLIKLGYAHNIKAAKKLISQKTSIVWDILEEISRDKVVLLNRAPTLHVLSILAYQPVLIEGKAIQLHPLVCEGYNADFDGDQMAIHLPLSDEAQEEGKKLMLGSINLLKPSDGKPVAMPKDEMVLGVYYLTFVETDFESREIKKFFSSVNEMNFALQNGNIVLHDKIKIFVEEKNEIFVTTPGRVIFNSILPTEISFVNKSLDNGALKELVLDIFKKFGPEKTSIILDEIKLIGNKYATISGITYAGSDLVVPKEKEDILLKTEERRDDLYKFYKKGFITSNERKNLVIEGWNNAKSKLAEKIKQNLPNYGSTRYIIESGARGKLDNINQVIGMKGLVANPAGETIEVPIASSFLEGLTALEYFTESHGGRKGKSDTALKTADAGYLTRRMVDVAQDIVVSEDDCGSSEGIIFEVAESAEINRTIGYRIKGRFLSKDLFDGDVKIASRNDLVDDNLAKIIDDKKIQKVEVRSPLYCKSITGCCRTCYGIDPSKGNLVEIGRPVGIIAAQSIGEPGLQLTLRTFHQGGLAGSNIIQGLPRVEELFEARSRYPAILAEDSGSVRIETKVQNGVNVSTIYIKTASGKTLSYADINSDIVIVEDGQEVQKGDALTLGSMDPKQLFDLKGKVFAEKYLLSEIQKVYIGQGQEILDKHIEVILARMFALGQVVDSGSTDLYEGDFVDMRIVNKRNKNAEEKAIIEPTVLGITKAALNTESFLSAASFEETTKVLIEAATKGKIDLLSGLKENVMIGRRIPSGTGYRVSSINYFNVEEYLDKFEKVKY